MFKGQLLDEIGIQRFPFSLVVGFILLLQYVCVPVNWAFIGSDNNLEPVWYQAIT